MKRLYCWKCGTEQVDEPLPLARAAQCPHCRAQLHVCRICEFFDPAVANACREPIAEPVMDKDRANFCGYLQPSPRAWSSAGQDSASRDTTALDALFGESAPAAGDGCSRDAVVALESLFGPKEPDN